MGWRGEPVLASEAVVSGGVLLREELTSPLILGVAALVAGFSLAGFLYYRRRPEKRSRAWLSLAMGLGVLALLLAIFLVTIQPGVNYGIVLEDGVARITFYGSESVEIELCEADFSLVDTDDALGMLSVRTNGLADPLSGIYMGYYKTRDGSEALVIVYAGSIQKTLLARTDGRVIMVGVPGVEDVYNAILDYQAENCR